MRRLVLVGGLAAHARLETGQGVSEAEESQESDDDGDGKDEAEHEESLGSEEAGGVGAMPTAAGGAPTEEEEPEDDGSQDELDPDAIVRQYLQHEAETDEP